MTFGRRHPRCDGAQIAPFGRDSDCHAGDRTAVQKWRLRARHAADRVISVFSQAGNAEDTEGMDGKRAEAYLRFRAEAELRRAAAQPWDSAVADDCAARVMRVARVLTAVHALEAEVADQILDDFELALGARQTGSAGQRGAGLRSLMATPPSARRRREVLMNSPPSAAAGPRRPPPGKRTRRDRPDRGQHRAGRAADPGLRQRWQGRDLRLVASAHDGRRAVHDGRARVQAFVEAAFPSVHRGR
jgi:hypothetical protein